MKQLLCTLTVAGLVAMPIRPAQAQQPVRAQQQAQAPLQCDTLAASRAQARPLAVGRHQVVAPRDPARGLTSGSSARAVRGADGRIHVRKAVATASGVRVSKARPMACPVVAAAPASIPGSAVGDVDPTPTTSVAPGEVVPSFVPTVGGRSPFPLLGGLLLGGSAIAIGSHTPGRTPAVAETTPTVPTVPVVPVVPSAPTVPPPPTPPTTPSTPTTPTPPITPSAPEQPGAPGTVVPEPATIVLTGIGVALLVGVGRRRPSRR